jgi:hypothetical protein
MGTVTVTPDDANTVFDVLFVLRSRRSSDRWRVSEIVSKRGVAPSV